MDGVDLSEGSDYNPFLITDIGTLTDHQNNIRIGTFRHSLEPSQYSHLSSISYAVLYMDVLALSECSDDYPFLITDMGTLKDHSNISIGTFRHPLEPSQYSHLSSISYAEVSTDCMALSEGSDR